MPIPEGQSCSNCLYYVAFPGASGRGDCCVDQPGRTAARTSWPRVKESQWCGRWASSTPGYAPTEDTGLGSLRGSNDSGESVPSPSAWTQLAPGFASLAPGALNVDSPSPGVLRVNYAGAPAEYTVAADFIGSVTIGATSNNQEFRLAAGRNGVVETQTQVRAYARSSGDIYQLTVFGSRQLNQLDTVELYVQSSSSVNYYDFHARLITEGLVEALWVAQP